MTYDRLTMQFAILNDRLLEDYDEINLLDEMEDIKTLIEITWDQRYQEEVK